MIQNKYIATLQHDGGKSKIYVWATNKNEAIKYICNIENCPENAILKIYIQKPTISEIKKRTLESAPYFFSRSTMKFFGQQMKDFKVYREGENFRIYAPHKHGATERLFNPFTNQLEFIN